MGIGVIGRVTTLFGLDGTTLAGLIPALVDMLSFTVVTHKSLRGTIKKHEDDDWFDILARRQAGTRARQATWHSTSPLHICDLMHP
jgi:hypothetical protein